MEEVTDAVHDLHLSDSGQDMTGLPDTIIVTNLSDAVFDCEQTKAEFERLFQEFEADLTFQYLKSFRRARIVFSSTLNAARARVHRHEHSFQGKALKCYFAQPIQTGSGSPHLRPPVPTKQFLISPPASPPVDWEPVREGNPIINYDLLAAIANLAPGEAHELQPPSDVHPGIVVHICEDPVGYGARPIPQTSRPETDPAS